MTDECDVCPICLGDENELNGLSIVKCENRHFMHSGCFSAMACQGLKLRCPICRGAFKCEICGETLRRLICMKCYFDTMIYKPTPDARVPINNDYSPVSLFSGLFYTNTLKDIIHQHIIGGLFSILFLSHISSWWPLSIWTNMGTMIFFVNAVWGFDRIIVELLRQIEAGRGGGGFLWGGLMRIAYILHGVVRLLWILVGLTAIQHWIGI